MEVFDRLDEHDYESVLYCRDEPSGLRAIIAIHDTTLGPALGGVRMFPYASEAEALTDVLRLARGMTYKAAISGCSLGGGKSVIIGDPRRDKSHRLLEAMGRFIESLGGGYIAGQDIGTSADDMGIIRGVTRHVSCVSTQAGGAGDPSYATAYGVTCGIRGVLEAVFGTPDLGGRHIAVQGLGHVGSSVARYCGEAGARLTVCDVREAPVARAVDELGAEAVAPGDIYDVECDVFSPCSVGGIVNDDTVPRLGCRAIAGGANNVLAEARHGAVLMERGIVYAPDYLVNSGGLIRCEQEISDGSTEDDVLLAKVSQIQAQVRDVIKRAKDGGITPGEAADRIAEERLTATQAAGEAWNPLRNAQR